MSSFNTYKYFLKNKDGNLVPKTSGELIQLIKNKDLKADTRIYTTQYNKWMKLKDLNIYKNKSQFTDNEAINSSESIEINISKKAPIAPISHEQYITLIDEVEDARSVSFHAQYEQADKIKKLQHEKQSYLIKCQQLEYKLTELEEEKSYLIEEKKGLKKEYKKMRDELNDLSSKFEDGSEDIIYAKNKAEINKLKNENHLLKNESENIRELNNKLILQNETLKQDINSYIIQKEDIETKYIKIKNEKEFFVDRLNSYKKEIQRLAHELSRKKDLYSSIAAKFEESHEVNNSLRVEVSNYKSELDHMQKKHAHLLDDYEQLQEKHHEITKELGELRKTHFNADINLQKLHDENDYLNKKLRHIIDEKNTLEDKVEGLSQLPPVPTGHISIVDHDNQIQKYKDDIQILFEDNKKLEDQLRESELSESKNQEMLNEIRQKSSEVEYIKARAFKMLQKKKQLEALAKLQKQKIKKLEEFKQMATKKFGDSVQDLNNQIKAYKQEIEEERNKNTQIINSLSNVNKDEVLVDDLLNAQKDIADEEIVADQESIGELFEINNEPIWKLKVDNLIDGPYSFLDIKNMLEQREINPTDSLKKPGSPWKKIEDIFEFNTEILTKKEDDETKLFIKRDDLRIPVFEDVTMTLDGEVYQGKCSNLSSGGCFIESTAFNNRVFVVGKELKIKFTGEGDHKGVEINTQLRSITNDMPPGAGVQFLDMNEEKLSKLNHFFQKFSRTFGKKAA
jgi:DNA repair exonuclease SbcCD ATPase subunit